MTTRFAYDGSNVWADLDGGNTVEARRVYGDGVDQPLARIEAGGANAGVAFYVTDRLGSVRDLTDGSGQVRDHLEAAFAQGVRRQGETEKRDKKYAPEAPCGSA